MVMHVCSHKILAALREDGIFPFLCFGHAFHWPETSLGKQG